MKNKFLLFLILIGVLYGCSFEFKLPHQNPTPPGWSGPAEGELSTQGTRPDQAPEKDPAATDAIYTQESGSLNKVRFDSAKQYFQPKILSTQLSYAVDTTSTDNPDSLRGYIVTDVNGNKFYIDSTRLGIRLNPASGGSAQTLSFSSPNLSISSGNSVDISAIDTDTDNQTLSVDSTGTTYSITIEDGNSISFAKGSGGGTDDQTIDTFDISSNTLRLSLEDDGEAYQSVDLSPYLDNTDDQTIDVFQLNGNDLELSLESDGEATQTVDLSSYLDNTDTQDLDIDSTSTTYTISLDGSPDISFAKATSGATVPAVSNLVFSNASSDTIDFGSNSFGIIQASFAGVTNDTLYLTGAVNGGSYSIDLDNVSEYDTLYFNDTVLDANEDTVSVQYYNTGTIISLYYDGTNYILPATSSVTPCSTPVASFTADSDTISSGGTVDFTDTSTGDPTSWAWTFEQGTPSSSTAQNPSGVTWDSVGTWEVQLIATNSCGSDTATTNIVLSSNSSDSIFLLGPWAYYRFDQLDVGDGNEITAVPDSSGNSRDLVQTDSTKTPLLDAAEINGYPVATFDGNKIIYSEAEYTWNSDSITVVALAKYDNDNSSMTLAGMHDGDSNKKWLLGIKGDPSGYDRFNTSSDGSAITESVYGNQTETIFATFVFAGSSSSELFRKNGSTVSQVSGSVATIFDSDEYLVIGGVGPTTEVTQFEGDLVVLAIFDKTLTLSEVQSIEAYLVDLFAHY